MKVVQGFVLLYALDISTDSRVADHGATKLIPFPPCPRDVLEKFAAGFRHLPQQLGCFKILDVM